MPAFILHYIGYERWLTWRNMALLSIVPVVGTVLSWTNEWHGLIWARIHLDIEGNLALVDITYGPYFWLYVTYNYLLLLAAAALFLRATLRAPPLQRRQSAVMLIGTLFPTITIALYLAGLSPLRNLDLGSLGWSLTGLTLAGGLFRTRIFDLVPVARDQVVGNMSDGVLVLDTQGRIVDANPAMLQLLQRPAREVIGQQVGQVLRGQADLIERYRDKPEVHDEVTIGTGSAQRCFDLRISPLHGRREQLTGRVVVLRDITERRREAEERERLIQELDAFAHTVAHDLKTPLGAVIGYAELLQLSDLTEAQRQQYQRVIAWTGDKMANIIDELLLLAGMHKEQAWIERLDMKRIVDEALRRLAFMREEYQARVTQPASWPPALGYAPWIEEVWVNYLSNAIKYGGRPPRVELGADTLPDGTPRFWVRDNGPGIAAEDQTRLFVSFTQIDRVRAQGQGLGLSIVRRIVERLGGEVGVESEPGRGSLFYFTLSAAEGID
jgi:PAS domain S-box-containing protein